MIAAEKTSAEILGTLYKDEVGDIILLNEHGAHTILIEHSRGGMPEKADALHFVRSNEVVWDGVVEYWAEDIWGDLVEDSRDEYGSEYAEKLKHRVTCNFQSLILTGR